MRCLRLTFKTEPSFNDLKEVNIASFNMFSNGFVKNLANITREHDSLGWWIQIECHEEDYHCWYSFYWGYQFSRKVTQ